MELLLIVTGFAVILAVAYACFNFFTVKKLDEGTDRMKEIAGAIRIGANAFIRYEYKIVAIIGLIVAAALGILISWQTACAFIIGALMSASAGWVGMKIATYANVRVTNRARESGDLGKTLKVAFKGGSVMGLCVAGFALLGILIVYVVFGILGQQINDIANDTVQHGLLFKDLETGFTMTLSGYALGCSIIALFNRVGGGIYTKAADMGADLVGKTEAHIPEDDPRNPATIADNVGDNVGDVAGLGSDLLESYVGAILSGVILASELFMHKIVVTAELLKSMLLFPIVFAGLGLIACVIGISYILLKKNLSSAVHRELNIATWISAGMSVALCFLASFFMFRNIGEAELNFIGFKLGNLSPWVASIFGIAAGIIIGVISEYYTSYDFSPTRRIAAASREGSALTITQGLANGMISCMLPVIVLAVAIFGSYSVAGMYGIACSALGMLSFVAATVSVDTYGPISDNAGGIAEMSALDPGVRAITDKLDSVGNTTAAIGKGFAIGSAALAALSMMTSYLFAFTEINIFGGFGGITNWIDQLTLNVMNPLTLCGMMVGAAIPFMFSGMLIEAVAKAARKMVDEVRRQFKEIPGILTGEAKPDYKTCIEISSQGSLKEMRVPCIIAILFPVVCGFIFGASFVGGLLIGATVSAIMLAIFTGNAGGAWDNGKKYIEAGGIEGHGKGSPAHEASVVGDTVGDPLKDTVGPSLDILIKIMSTISLVCVVVFSEYNLFSLLGWI